VALVCRILREARRLSTDVVRHCCEGHPTPLTSLSGAAIIRPQPELTGAIPLVVNRPPERIRRNRGHMVPGCNADTLRLAERALVAARPSTPVKATT
jgi:hypothetical protein